MHEIDLDQLKFINSIIRYISRIIEIKFGQQIITSLYRINDPRCHGTLPVRAIDYRFNDKSYDIRDFVNSHWIYDPKRPVYKIGIVHDTGQGLHLHIQVHPNTVARSTIRRN